MSDARRVSVIVNNFNYADFLRQAIDSALGQTYRPLEVIVVDDGSTDCSRAVIQCYGDKVQPIFKENGGQASTFNVGFARCRGDVIMYLDADDVLLPGAIEAAAACFDSPHVVNVHWPLWLIDRNGRRTGEVLPKRPLAAGTFRDTFIQEGPDSYQGAPTSGNAWSRSFLSQVLPAQEADFRNGADGFLITLAPLFGAIRTLTEPQGFYRVHERNHFWTASVDERNSRSLIRYEHRADTLRQQLAALGIEADPSDWKRRNPYFQWMDRLGRATEELKKLIPAGECYLLVDDNQWGIELLSGRRAIPFPEKDGFFAGPPADDAMAIREFERLRGAGPAYMVFGWPGFWWLDHYVGLRRHLDARFERVVENDRLIVFALGKPA